MGNYLSKIVNHSAFDGALSAVINEVNKKKVLTLKIVYSLGIYDKFKTEIITPHEDRFPPQAMDLEYKTKLIHAHKSLKRYYG